MSGVVINGGAKNLVQNNFVGTDVTGSKAIGIQRWGVGSHVFHATANKQTNFLASFPSLTIPAGWVVTATATDHSGNTSEFSQSIVPKTNKIAPGANSQSAAPQSTAMAAPLDLNPNDSVRRKMNATDLALVEMVLHINFDSPMIALAFGR